MTKLFMILVLALNTAFAAQTARVLMVRGNVTQLSPGSTSAKKVKKGDVYYEDTSVLTGDKSIVRLKFADKSVMNLGPKSKVVVSKMPKKKANMISLLTGSIKAEVDKKNTGKNKLIVKTRSAVMGIRGTKFQASYNAVNKNTSLVTVEGKVAMVKKDTVRSQLVKKEVVETNNETIDLMNEPKEEVVQKVVSGDEELDALDDALNNSTDTVEVNAGKFSGVQEGGSKPSVPVKIAPVQYEVLAKSMGSDKKASDVMETADAESEVDQLANSAEDGQVVQKPGGYIDFATGLYVAPSDEAKLDEKTGTYKVEKEIGKVDELTGDYIPPQGVKLDAKKGFVVDKKELAKVASSEDMEKTLALVREKNKEVVKVNKIKATSISSSTPKDKKSNVGFEFTPFSEVLTLDTDEGGESEFLTESAYDVLLTYERSWSKKYNTMFKLGFVTYEVDESDGSFREGQNDDDMIFVADTRYLYSKNLTLNLEIMDRAYYFVYPADNGDAIVDPVSLTSISFGATYAWRTWRDIGVSLGGKVMLFAPNEANLENGTETVESFGFNLFANGEYALSNKMNLSLKAFLQNINHELSDADAEFDRFTIGSQLSIDYKL